MQARLYDQTFEDSSFHKTSKTVVEELPEWIANQMGHTSTVVLFKFYSLP